MEAGNGAAGHGDEQQRPEILTILRCETGEHRNLGGINAAHEDHADCADEHREVQQERSQIVARLQEQPDRQHRSGENVDDQRPAPELDAKFEGRHDPRGRISIEDRADNQRHHDDGAIQQVQAQPVHQPAEQHGDDHVYDRGEGNRRVGRERLRRQFQEYRDDQGQSQPSEDQEQFLRRRANPFENDFADRQALVSQGSDQRAHVMNAAEKYRTNQHPEIGRQPAEHRSRGDRSDDRAGAGDGRKMVAHQNGRMGRAIINPVIKTSCGSFLVGIQGKDIFQPFAVCHVRYTINNDCNDKHGC